VLLFAIAPDTPEEKDVNIVARRGKKGNCAVLKIIQVDEQKGISDKSDRMPVYRPVLFC